MINLPTDSVSHSIILVVFAIFQGTLVLVLIYLFVEKVLWSKKKEVSSEINKQDAYDKALEILEKAKEESLNLLKSSHSRARQLLSESKTFADESRQDLDEHLHSLSEDHLHTLESISQALIEDYKYALESERNQGIKEISDTSEQLKSELVGEIRDFKELIHKETVEAGQSVREEFHKEYAGVRQELENYRRDQYEKIDRNIYKVLSKVTRDILGKTLSVSEQEEVIFQLLQEAKREGNFEL